MGSACNAYLPDDVRGSGLEKRLIWELQINTDSFEKRFSLGFRAPLAVEIFVNDYTT